MAVTRGISELRKAGLEHTPMEYRYEAGGGTAERAADALGVEHERMFKSLVARAGDELVFALLPAGSELSLKKLAAAAGVKHAAMAQPAEAERATGYQVGGISPLGSRKVLRAFIDETATGFARICLNSGGRGAIVEVDTDDLIRLTAATPVDLRQA